MLDRDLAEMYGVETRRLNEQIKRNIKRFPDDFMFNGATYATAGTYAAHLTNSVGCDSTATLVLKIKEPSSSTTTASICRGDSYTFNGMGRLS